MAKPKQPKNQLQKASDQVGRAGGILEAVTVELYGSEYPEQGEFAEELTQAIEMLDALQSRMGAAGDKLAIGAKAATAGK